MAESENVDTGTVEEDTRSIYQRMADAAAAIKVPLVKDGKVMGKGDTVMYEYTSHDAVMMAVRQPMLDNGIYPAFDVINCTNNGNRTEMEVKATFRCTNPLEFDELMSVTAFGYGADTQDKGPGKAYSYAVKNALLKAFMIPAGDDIEEHTVEHDGGAKQSDVDKAKAETSTAMITAANNLKSATEACKTIKEVNALKRENKAVLADMTPVTVEYFDDLFEARKQQIEEFENE